MERDRRLEWFVPSWGPLRWRIAIGLLFLPYTGMVLAYTIIGAMLAPRIFWDRVVALVVIYFLGLGIAAHALDAIGAKGSVKPWGNHFSRKQLWGSALLALLGAYSLGFYYIVTVAPWLIIIALLEGFFLLAYNLEWFDGRFHTDYAFAFSWGILPVLAGYVLQTNTLSLAALVLAVAMGLMSLVEINASRPYKALKRQGDASVHGVHYETLLKCVSLSTIFMATGMVLWRLQH